MTQVIKNYGSKFKNQDISTGSLPGPFAHLLEPKYPFKNKKIHSKVALWGHTEIAATQGIAETGHTRAHTRAHTCTRAHAQATRLWIFPGRSPFKHSRVKHTTLGMVNLFKCMRYSLEVISTGR